MLIAWVLLPDHGHAIIGAPYPETIADVMESIKTSSMILINRQRCESGELWHGRFFDRALKTLKEYNEKVDYIHWNPVRRGLGSPSPRLGVVQRKRVFRRQCGGTGTPL